MNLRQSTTEDLEQLKPLVKALFDDYHSMDSCYDYVEADSLVLSADTYYVVEVDGKVVAFMKSNFNEKKKLGLVENVYVDPEYRHKGYAKALLEDAKERLKKMGATKLHLMTDHRSAAYAFWEKQGFKPFASRVSLDL